MTQIRKSKINKIGYEQGDVISNRPDGIGWSPTELYTNNSEIEANLTLSDNEMSKLMMTDEGPVNYSAIAKIPTFHSSLTSAGAMSVLHRRKYHNNGNNIQLKANAQARK